MDAPTFVIDNTNPIELNINESDQLAMDIGSGATTWDNVALKPFNTIGSGLGVDGGALYVTEQPQVNDVKVNGTSVVSNKVANVPVPIKTSDLSNDSGFITAEAIAGKEDTANKVTSINNQSTDTQYPSAKCIYDIVGNIEAVIDEIRGVV